MQRGEIYLASFPFGDVLGMKLRPFQLCGRGGFPLQRHGAAAPHQRSDPQGRRHGGRPIQRHPSRSPQRPLGDHGVGVSQGQSLGGQARIMQPAGQPPTGGFKVRKAAGQGGLTATTHHHQGRDKIPHRFALMTVCLGQHGVDILFQASGQRVLCQGKPNSLTSLFSLPLAPLANVSRPQQNTRIYAQITTALRQEVFASRRVVGSFPSGRFLSFVTYV